MKKHSDGREHGFTLIELLVVVLIIGILSAIAVPIYTNHKKAAIDAGIKTDVVNASRSVADWDIKNAGQIFKIPGPDSKLAQELSLSGTNRVIIRGNSADYCIVGTNPDGDEGVAGIVYSSSNGGLNQFSECDENFQPDSLAEVEGDLIFWENDTESKPATGGDVVPPEEAPVSPPIADGTHASCGDVSFTAQAGTFITCQNLASNKKQDSFKLVIGSHSKTDIRWNAEVDLVNMPGRVASNLETPKAFESEKLSASKFRVWGKDNSSSSSSPASAFVSEKKSHVLIVKVAWK